MTDQNQQFLFLPTLRDADGAGAAQGWPAKAVCEDTEVSLAPLVEAIAIAQAFHPGCVFDEAALPQRSDAWHLFRAQGLGASEAGALMELSPWQSLAELYDQRTGQAPPIVENNAMRRGSRLETLARRAFLAWAQERQKQAGQRPGLDARPLCLAHPELGHIRCSLDGFTSDGQILEIKAPSHIRRHRETKRGIPPYYYAQVQQQLFVANAIFGCATGYFVSFFPPSENPHEWTELEALPLPELAERLRLAEDEDADQAREARAGKGRSGLETPALIVRPVSFDREFCAQLAQRAGVFWQAVQERSGPPVFKPKDLPASRRTAAKDEVDTPTGKTLMAIFAEEESASSEPEIITVREGRQERRSLALTRTDAAACCLRLSPPRAPASGLIFSRPCKATTSFLANHHNKARK